MSISMERRGCGDGERETRSCGDGEREMQPYCGDGEHRTRGERRAASETRSCGDGERETQPDCGDGERWTRGERRAAGEPWAASERVREQRASVSRNAWRCERAASKRWCLMPGDANGRLRSEPAAAQGYSGQKPPSRTRTSSILAIALCSRTSSKTDTEGVLIDDVVELV